MTKDQFQALPWHMRAIIRTGVIGMGAYAVISLAAEFGWIGG